MRRRRFLAAAAALAIPVAALLVRADEVIQ